MPLQHNGKDLLGSLLDVSAGPKLLDHHRVHATMGCGRRVVLVAYSVRGFTKLSEEDRDKLECLGFHKCPFRALVPSFVEGLISSLHRILKSLLDGASELLRERARDNAPKEVANDQPTGTPARLSKGNNPAKSKRGQDGRRDLRLCKQGRDINERLRRLLIIQDNTCNFGSEPKRPGAAPFRARRKLESNALLSSATGDGGSQSSKSGARGPYGSGGRRLGSESCWHRWTARAGRLSTLDVRRTAPQGERGALLAAPAHRPRLQAVTSGRLRRGLGNSILKQ